MTLPTTEQDASRSSPRPARPTCARVPLPAGCHRDRRVRAPLALVLDGVLSRAECAALRARAGRTFQYVRSARHEVGGGVGAAVPIQRPREYGLSVFEDARTAAELWRRVQVRGGVLARAPLF